MIPVIRVFCPGSGIYPGHHLHRTSSLPPFTIASSAHQLAPTLSRAAKLRGVQIDVFKYARGIIKTTVASACYSCFWVKFPIIPYKWLLLRKNLRRSGMMIFKQFRYKVKPRGLMIVGVSLSHIILCQNSLEGFHYKEWRCMSLKSEWIWNIISDLFK